MGREMAEHDDTKLRSASEPEKARSAGGLKGIDEAAGKALGPAAEEFGKEIAPLGKQAGQLANRVGTLLIRTLQPLVYAFEKSADWIEKAVTDRLKDVSPEKIVAPNPRIAVPAMQALTYSMDDEPIREMFANLLAADMNAETKQHAHPAFVELIKEMTPADARVLKITRDCPQCAFYARIGWSSAFGVSSAFITAGTHYSFAIEGSPVEGIEMSVNNLKRLGLLMEQPGEYPALPDNAAMMNSLKTQYEQRRQSIEDNPEGRKQFGIPEGAHVEVAIQTNGLYLTPLGRSFTAICLRIAPHIAASREATARI
jgi:hypothetical protein